DLGGDLSGWFAHADAVVYAGWPVSRPSGQVRPGRPPTVLRRVCQGAARAGVRTLVVGSNGAVYRTDDVDRSDVDRSGGPGQAASPIGEDGPIGAAGRPAVVAPLVEAEQLLDQFEQAHPVIRTVRLRTGWVLASPGKASEGPLAPASIGGRLVGGVTRLNLAPSLGGRAVQPLHVADLTEAIRLVLTGSVSGAFNLAAEPIDDAGLAGALGTRRVPVSLARLLGPCSLAGRLG